MHTVFWRVHCLQPASARTTVEVHSLHASTHVMWCGNDESSLEPTLHLQPRCLLLGKLSDCKMIDKVIVTIVVAQTSKQRGIIARKCWFTHVKIYPVVRSCTYNVEDLHLNRISRIF